MVKKLKDMERTYNEKVPVFARRWGEITPKKRPEYEKGISEVLEVSTTEVKRGDDYEAGVKRAVPYFEAAVKDKGSKLAENYRIAMTTD
ncbi:MAG: hypothetical protein ACUVTD_08760 [Nitrososphaerales archaeon]